MSGAWGGERGAWVGAGQALDRIVAEHPRWLMARANREAMFRWNADCLCLFMAPMAGGARLIAMEDALDELVARAAMRRLP